MNEGYGTCEILLRHILGGGKRDTTAPSTICHHFDAIHVTDSHGVPWNKLRTLLTVRCVFYLLSYFPLIPNVFSLDSCGDVLIANVRFYRSVCVPNFTLCKLCLSKERGVSILLSIIYSQCESASSYFFI